jgi:peptidoglycan/LPS O-acetylase OafA/YrhL
MAVLLFHVGIPGFQGGFVGVDIFFVISGFLITRLIVSEVEAGRFNFAHFYLRRARRLFPALFITIVSTFVAGAVLLSPQHFKRLSGSALYGLLSLSNVFFWTERGYFDTDAAFKPLLHTWSLSVEEQFYLIWPALIVLGVVLGARVRQSWLLPAMLTGIGLISICASQTWPGADRDASFFLTPFRVYEFVIGSLVVWIERGRRVAGWAAECLVVAGFVLMLTPVFLYGSATIFPGWSAVVPCLGSAILIYAGQAPWMGRLLHNSVAIWVGSISYSLYLVHWPIIVLTKYTTLHELTAREQIAVLLASTGAAILLYRFVEMPFRLRGKETARLTPSAFGLACALLTLIVVVPIAHAWATDGWAWRYPQEMRRIATLREGELIQYTWSNWVDFEKPGFEDKPERWFIIGDSQASDLLNLMVEAHLGRDISIRTFNIDSTCSAIFLPPEREEAFYATENVLTARSPDKVLECKGTRSRLFASPLFAKATRVFIAPVWQPYSAPYVASTISKIRSLTTAPIVVVGSKVMAKGSIDIALKHKSIADIEREGARQIIPWVVAMNRQIASDSELQGAIFMDLLSVICPSPVACRVVTPDGYPVMVDEAHYTRWGARLLAPEVVKLLN